MHKMTLPDFLKWAFAEELAHVAVEGGSGGGSILSSYAALGTRIDVSGSTGGLPDVANVHPDALKANEAVMMLAGDELDLPSDWAPFPDMDDPHGLIAAKVREVIERRALRYGGDLRNNLIAIFVSLAVMRREPDWTAEQPRFSLVSRGGKPAWFKAETGTDTFGRVYHYEVDGYDAKARRPRPGAYRKYEIDDAFSGAVQARIDWYLWSGAMLAVAQRLATGLKSHEIKPYEIDREPWLKTAKNGVGGQSFENSME